MAPKTRRTTHLVINPDLNRSDQNLQNLCNWRPGEPLPEVLPPSLPTTVQGTPTSTPTPMPTPTPTPTPMLSEISTLTTVPTFESEWSSKACAGNVVTTESQFNWSWVKWEKLPGYTIPLSRSNARLTSFQWRFGVPIEHHDTKKRYWLCQECHCEDSENRHYFNIEKGSSSVLKHIREVHRLTTNKEGQVIPFVNYGIATVADKLSLNANNYREQEIINELAREFDEKRFRRLLIQWIVHDNVSFRQVDGPAFREFVTYLSPRAGEALPCDVSVKLWIMEGYRLHKEAVKRELSTATSKIHVSFDLWTSGNLLSLNGIVAHFLNKDFKPRAILLATPEQTGSHAGVDIAEEVIKVIKDFGIGDQLGYFMLDNASNNNTAIKAIAEAFRFDPIERRLRCSGHIINLIARHLLFRFDPDLFEAEEALPKDLKAQLKKWRKQGPISKAHNLLI